MDILHAVFYDSPNFLELLMRPENADGVSLNKDVALRQQFDSLENCETKSRHPRRFATHLERTTVWTNDPLPSLDKPLLIPNYVTDLDDITGDIIIQNLNCLTNSDSSCKQLDHIPGFENDIWVICFSRCPH